MGNRNWGGRAGMECREETRREDYTAGWVVENE